MTNPASLSFRPRAERHPFILIALHWLTAVLILAEIALILVQEDVGGRALRLWLLDQHRSLGLLVLVLVSLRLMLRRRHRARLPRHDLPFPVALASAAGHIGLYDLLLVTPILGWAQTSARGLDATLLGLIRLPPLVHTDLDLADTLASWHQLAAWSLLALVAVHFAAAVWHHWVRRDGVLVAMLPGPRPVDPRLDPTRST